MTTSKTVTLETAEKIYLALRNVTTDNIGLKYAIAKLKSQLTPEIEIIKSLETPSAEIEEYSKEFFKAKLKFALRGDNGEPITSPQNPTDYMIDPKQETEFIQEMSRLENKYKNAIEERIRQLDDSRKLKKEKTIDLDIFIVKVTNESIGIASLPQVVFDILVDIGMIEFE